MQTTTKLSTKVLNQLAFNYILDAIDGSGYGKELPTNQDKLQFLADTYKSEYGYPENIRYYQTHQRCFMNWIMGLPSSFNIDFENYRIIEIAKEWGSIAPDATDKAEDKILTNWFNFIASKTIQLMGKHNISIF